MCIQNYVNIVAWRRIHFVYINISGLNNYTKNEVYNITIGRRKQKRKHVKPCNRCWIPDGVFGSNFDYTFALLEIINRPQTNSNIFLIRNEHKKTDAFWQDMIVIFFILDRCELFNYLLKREPNS